jgi:hypothetical protein
MVVSEGEGLRLVALSFIVAFWFICYAITGVHDWALKAREVIRVIVGMVRGQ